MRIKQSRLTTATISNAVTTKDNEGVPTTEYVNPQPIDVEVWYANSRMDVEKFGNEINEVIHARVNKPFTIQITEKRNRYIVDGVEFSEGDIITYKDLDYKITSIVPYMHLKLEAKRL